MASHTKASRRGTPPKAPTITLADALEDDEPAATIETKTLVAEPPPVAVTLLAPAPALPVVASALPAAPADAAIWPLKALDIFNEHAAAVIELAEALGKARTVGEALDAQSRFASERYSSFAKRANEIVELTNRFTPFRFGVTAFVA